MRPTADLSLYLRVVLINGVVLVAGTVALALSPATVSTRVLGSEAVVLAVGLAVILLTNALLLRRSLAPPGPARLQDGHGGLARTGAAACRGGHRCRRGADRELQRDARPARVGAQKQQRQGAGRPGERAAAHRPGAPRRDRADPHRGPARAQTSSRPGPAPPRRGAGGGAGRCQGEPRGGTTRRPAAATRSARGSRSAERAVGPGHGHRRPQRRARQASFRAGAAVPRRGGRARGLPGGAGGAHQRLPACEARTVELSLSKQGEALLLRVADDGKGIHGASEGSGVLGMRERALLVDGRLDIGPGHLGGTEVRLLVPVRTSP